MKKDTPETVILAVKVTPKSSKTEITGQENGYIKIKLHAIPEKGEANNTLLPFSFPLPLWFLPPPVPVCVPVPVPDLTLFAFLRLPINDINSGTGTGGRKRE